MSDETRNGRLVTIAANGFRLLSPAGEGSSNADFQAALARATRPPKKRRRRKEPAFRPR